MKRYNSKTKKVKDLRARLQNEFDKRVPFPERTMFTTTVYPKIIRTSEDVFIESRIGDRFDNLAHEFYGDSTLYWIIAKANNLIHGGIAVEPGIKLRIPLNTEQIVQEFYQLNSER
tara:strand:+ start:252 stop:599 length:348 start_codon:yes stop_codon:yes gene_type:complete